MSLFLSPLFDGARLLLAETHVHGIRLVELGRLLDLAHHDQDRAGAGKNAIAAAALRVGLPGAGQL